MKRTRTKPIIFTALILLFFVFPVLFILSGMRYYKVFTSRDLVASVECDQDLETKDKILRIDFHDQKITDLRLDLIFEGDEWVLEGRIIRWKDYFAFFGAKNYYRLERISGRFFDPGQEQTATRSVYALSDAPDRLWMLVYKLQRIIPLVEAVYGSSVFVPFEPGKKFEVYVTYSGFMIKDITPEKKRPWWNIG